MAIEKAQPNTRKTKKPKLAPLPKRKRGQPLWEYIVALGNSLPDEVKATMPTDGAANHDHYIYGTPKQYE